MRIDLRVSQLLCSRLCHDLVGASGAVAAGLELVGDLGLASEDSAAAFDMTVNSSRQLSARLAFFRMAFGSGGGQGGQPLTAARAVAEGYLADHGAALDWPDVFPGVAADAAGGDAAKLLLNLVLMGKEALPRGGRVAVHLAPVEGGLGAAVTASGPGARVRPADREAMAAGFAAEDLTPHTVHAYFTACLAQTLGGAVEVGEAADEVRLAAALAAG